MEYHVIFMETCIKMRCKSEENALNLSDNFECLVFGSYRIIIKLFKKFSSNFILFPYFEKFKQSLACSQSSTYVQKELYQKQTLKTHAPENTLHKIFIQHKLLHISLLHLCKNNNS